jgi:hypothetical protein
LVEANFGGCASNYQTLYEKMTWLYCGIILLGSCLLFLVQPMCAKMLLPLVGGTPAAWNTCLVFFQAGLLGGYAYAHAVPRRIGVARHALLHLLLLIMAFFTLPISLPDEVREGWHPVAWLLASLAVSVGLPFVLLAAGAPLVQQWFVAQHRVSPRDPYFLYAASNLGSFLALGLFPFVLEPNWSLSEQSEVWKFGFLAYTVLLALCLPLRSHLPNPPLGGERPVRKGKPTAPEDRTTSRWERARWIMLALIPSSLLLSVTTHLTTDLAAIPLFWLIPMGIYLVSFILVFAREPVSRATKPALAAFVRWLPMVVVVIVFVMLSEATQPLLLVMGLHLLAFFWLAVVCHGELSRSRPPPKQLSSFYLCLAFGGVLGGVLNALAAPLLFSGLYEYPLMIALACLFGLDNASKPACADWGWSAGIGVLTVILVMTFQSQWFVPLAPGPVAVAAIFGFPLLLCFVMQRRTARFALGIGAVLLSSGLYDGIHGSADYRERSYFGIHRVTEKDGFRQLIHGDTVHGQQSLDRQKRRLPLTYYAHTGPVGDIFRSFQDDPRLLRVGVVGLGTGSLAAYSQSGQEWTFFEIDPSVKHIAENPKFFTYLDQAQGKMHIDLGDARLQLRKSQQTFNLLIVDAFVSDAIPLHLLTREALSVYLGRLEPRGLLAFHISNSYVDLEPVLANLAADESIDGVAYVRQHRPGNKERDEGVMASDWLVLGRQLDDLKPLLERSSWRPARRRPEWRVWTDEASNLYQVLRFRDWWLARDDL